MWVYILLALPLIRLLYDFLDELHFRQRQYKHGCCAPRELELSIPFGIPALFKFAKAYNCNEFHEATQNQYLSHNSLTFREQSLGRTLVNTIEPDNIKTVLATKFKHYDLASRHDQFQPLMGEGIFTASGQLWQRSRQFLRPQFTTQQISQLESLEFHCNELINAIRDSNSNDNKTDVQKLFFRLTLDSATEFLFGESTMSLSGGKNLTQERAIAAELFEKNFAIAQKWALYRTVAEDLYWLCDSFEYRRAVKNCHEFVDYYVQRALETKVSEDANRKYVFLEELTKQTRDPIVLRDQAMSVLLAGRDTTAGLLSFTVALLLRNKKVWYKLREEVLSEFGKDIKNITFHSLKRCTYLQHVISEVLRLYPVVPINSRQAARDTTLPLGGGVDENEPIFIPKGTIVQYHTYSLHRHEKFWGKDANEFIPERWENDQVKKSLQLWRFIPFNGGPRICLGMNFALTEAAFTLARLCQTFKDIEPIGKLKNIKQKAALTSSVSGGVHVKFI